MVESLRVCYDLLTSLVIYIHSFVYFAKFSFLTFYIPVNNLFIESSAFFHAANVVLEGACERVIVGDLYCDIPLGLYIIRGENVVLIGELVYILFYSDKFIIDTVHFNLIIQNIIFRSYYNLCRTWIRRNFLRI